ncbi:MAG: EAL domain-containing protein [Hasllibacter sp.]
MFDAQPPRQDDPFSFATAVRDRGILAAVDEAIALRRVMLAFQPIVRSAGQTAAPAFWEGLIRIMDGAGRIVPAADFVGRIETAETGRRVDALAVELGLAALAADPRLRLSINLGAHSIGYRPWTAALERGLAADPTVAERLILEIEEKSALAMSEVLRPFMIDLQRRGICFAVDGFGEGATDIAKLIDLGFDLAKLHGRCTQGVATDPDARLLVEALLDVTRRLDMLTVAQGVENARDAAALTALGVDCLQGFHFAAPALDRAARGRGRPAA